MKEELKRYLISSGVTFIASFLVFAVPLLLDGSFVWSVPTVMAVIISAVRIGVKSSWEILLPALLKLIDWAKNLVKK